MRVAIVEDDVVQGDTLEQWFTDQGADVHLFRGSRDFVRMAGRESFDLALVDWMLPEMTGHEVLRWLREDRSNDMPVIFITARDAEEDIVEALSAGADDYLVKPVRKLELMSRIEAVMRRARPHARSQKIEIAQYCFELQSKRVTVSGEPVDLTDKEFELAVFLFRNLGRLLSRGHMLEAVWGQTANLATRTVDTHVSRVRSKLNLRPDNGFRLVPTYNYGYRLEQLTDEQAEHEPA